MSETPSEGWHRYDGVRLTKMIRVRVSTPAYDELTEQAKGKGKKLGTMVREQLEAQAYSGIAEKLRGKVPSPG